LGASGPLQCSNKAKLRTASGFADVGMSVHGPGLLPGNAALKTAMPRKGLGCKKKAALKAAFISNLTINQNRRREYIALQAPFSHFFMKLVLAAPDSGLPSALTALVAQESAMHFFMNEVLAAPASALPSLPTALVSHVS
jgi:hypothetical protein